MTTTALNYQKGPREVKPVFISIHLTESDQVANFAKTFESKCQNDTSYNQSFHVIVDDKETIQLVDEADIAYDTNNFDLRQLTLSLVLVGNSAPIKEIADTINVTDWTDAYSVAVLQNAANQVAQWCKAYSIKPQKLSSSYITTVSEGQPITTVTETGIYGHSDLITDENGKPESIDPGSTFPWQDFINLVSTTLLTLG